MRIFSLALIFFLNFNTQAQKRSRPVEMSDTPKEMQELILSFLAPKDLMQIGSVSSQMYQSSTEVSRSPEYFRCFRKQFIVFGMKRPFLRAPLEDVFINATLARDDSKFLHGFAQKFLERVEPYQPYNSHLDKLIDALVLTVFVRKIERDLQAIVIREFDHFVSNQLFYEEPIQGYSYTRFGYSLIKFLENHHSEVYQEFSKYLSIHSAQNFKPKIVRWRINSSTPSQVIAEKTALSRKLQILVELIALERLDEVYVNKGLLIEFLGNLISESDIEDFFKSLNMKILTQSSNLFEDVYLQYLKKIIQWPVQPLENIVLR